MGLRHKQKKPSQPRSFTACMQGSQPNLTSFKRLVDCAPEDSTSVRIAAPPEVVFPYFTDPQLMVTWIGERADLDARPGGKFAVDVGGAAARGSYIAVEPPHRVVFTWGIPEDATLPPGSSTVEVELVADGTDTIVNL